MSDLEARFQSLRARARAMGYDVSLLLSARPVREGDHIITKYADGSAFEGVKLGDDDASLADGLNLIEGSVFTLESFVR